MKINKYLVILLILITILLSTASIYAEDNSNVDLNSNIDDINEDSIGIDDNQNTDVSLKNTGEESILSDTYKAPASDEDRKIFYGDEKDYNGKYTKYIQNYNNGTWLVKPYTKNPNQILMPTIQVAIDDANPGDTIILNGNFVHCHLIITKPLTIIAKEGTTLSPCPHQKFESDYLGSIYVSPEASGTVIQGIVITKMYEEPCDPYPFSIYVNGASNITIKDCNITIEYSSYDIDSIILENSNNVTITNCNINNTYNGVYSYNSSNINIKNNNISYSANSGICIGEDSRNINISNNVIYNNYDNAIAMIGSADNVFILNNIIEHNGFGDSDGGSGVYVNCNITKIEIKGNLFNDNNLHAVMYDYRVKNLNNNDGDDKLTIVDNNYFMNHKGMVLHHRIYVESENGGYSYNEDEDIYTFVGIGGNYSEDKGYSYMQHAFILNDVVCGHTYYTTSIPWEITASGNRGKYNLSLTISDIAQNKNGVYSISIIDAKGNVARDFNSFYVVFYLNKNNTDIEPREGDVYKKVSIKNGVATADFTGNIDDYIKTGNVILASLPGIANNIRDNPYAEYNVSDLNIPVKELPVTKLSSSILTTYPNAGDYFKVKLTDDKGNVLFNQKISFKVNGKTYSAKTDKNGIAKIKLYLSTKKTYSVIISYSGNNNYKSSAAIGKIIVKTGNLKSKIKASNLKIKKNSKKIFKFKLTTGSGKAIANQKVIVKFNGKIYNLKTAKNGIVKLKIKLNKVKKFKISMKYLGNSVYKSALKTNIITVTKK